MTRNLGDLVAGVFYLAIVFVIVRPDSTASAAVKDIGAALTALVKRASDLG